MASKRDVRIYSQSELVSMINAGKRAAVEQIVRTQAERYNKQITRAQNRGQSLVSVGGHRRINRNVGKLTDAQLVAQYVNVLQRFGVGEISTSKKGTIEKAGTGGATKKGLQKREKDLKEKLARVFGFDLLSDSEKKRFDNWLDRYYNKLSPTQKSKVFSRITEIEKILGGNIDKLWYGDLGALVESGKIESHANVNIEGTSADYATKGLLPYLYQLQRRLKARIK